MLYTVLKVYGSVSLYKCYLRNMRKEPNKQANFRLPEALLNELREVAEVKEMSQTDIVRDGLQEKINRIKSGIQRQREKQEAVAI